MVKIVTDWGILLREDIVPDGPAPEGENPGRADSATNHRARNRAMRALRWADDVVVA